MATLGQRLRELRAQRKLSQQGLADLAGVTKQTISQYERGVRKPDLNMLTELGDIFNVSTDYLTGQSDVTVRLLGPEDLKTLDLASFPNIHPVTTRRFPVLGSVSCGEPKLMDEEIDVSVDASEDIKADFVLRAKGDSMIGARIYDGDLVFVRKQDIVENGEIAVVAIDDEATLKRFYKYDELIVLRAENPAYKDQEYRPEQAHEIRVLGKAVSFQSVVK